MRLNKQNQGSFALFLWFVFLNSQLLVSLLAFFHWRLNHSGVPLDQMVFWDESVFSEPIGLVLAIHSVFLAGIGFALGNRFFAQARENAGKEKLNLSLLILAYVLLDGVGITGVILGVLKGNAALAFPFLVAGATLLVGLFPSGRRFPSAGPLG